MGGKEYNEYMKQYIFKAAEIFVNILMGLSALGAVVAIAYIIFLAQGSGMEKIVACYFIIIGFGAMIMEQFLEMKGKRIAFYKQHSLLSFLYFVFIIGEITAISIYYLLSKVKVIQESRESIYFALYAGIFGGISIWYVYHLFKKNVSYGDLKMFIQPFVLVVTMWGYVLDKFGVYKKYAIFFAAFIFSVSFIIDMISYYKREKIETVDVKIEKVSTVYEVCIISDNKIEYNYKITLKANQREE